MVDNEVKSAIEPLTVIFPCTVKSFSIITLAPVNVIVSPVLLVIVSVLIIDKLPALRLSTSSAISDVIVSLIELDCDSVTRLEKDASTGSHPGCTSILLLLHYISKVM